jgi:hypothetical protein
MEARPPEMMPSPPRPAAEFDRETAAGLDVFAMRGTHFGLTREFDEIRNGTDRIAFPPVVRRCLDPGCDTLAGGQQSLITQMRDGMAHGLPTDLQRR